MDPLLWAAVVITALIILLPCAFRLGFELGKQEALDLDPSFESEQYSAAGATHRVGVAMAFE